MAVPSTPVDLGNRERRVVGRHDDVGVAGQADATTETETVDRGDHRDLAVVHRREHGEAVPVHGDHRLVRGVGGELLDVDAGLETLAVGTQDHDVH